VGGARAGWGGLVGGPADPRLRRPLPLPLAGSALWWLAYPAPAPSSQLAAVRSTWPPGPSLPPAPRRAAGVTGLELMMSKDGTGSNRGFGFLEFFNHAAADKARRHLTDATFKWAPSCAPALLATAPPHPNSALRASRPACLPLSGRGPAAPAAARVAAGMSRPPLPPTGPHRHPPPLLPPPALAQAGHALCDSQLGRAQALRPAPGGTGAGACRWQPLRTAERCSGRLLPGAAGAPAAELLLLGNRRATAAGAGQVHLCGRRALGRQRGAADRSVWQVRRRGQGARPAGRQAGCAPARTLVAPALDRPRSCQVAPDHPAPWPALAPRSSSPRPRRTARRASTRLCTTRTGRPRRRRAPPQRPTRSSWATGTSR
jgi:hypothetical protein